MRFVLRQAEDSAETALAKIGSLVEEQYSFIGPHAD
jgi:hypothetical protein